MNRGDAYEILATRLNKLRAEGYDALLLRVGQPARSDTVQVNGESVMVEVEVSWADRERGKLQVCATAYGPSTWMTERLGESFAIGPSGPRVG